MTRMDSTLSTIAMLLILPCGLALGIGIAHFGPTPTLGAALCVAPLAIYLLSLLTVVLPYSRALDHRELHQDWNRAAELVRRAEQSQRVEIRGWMTSEPMLSMSRSGIRSSTYGELQWADIDGIYLHRTHVRGMTFYTLKFRVPTLSARTDRMHPYTRLRYRFRRKAHRDRVEFQLLACGESPRVIDMVCTTLWERAVGRRNSWTPDNRQLERELQTIREQYDREIQQLNEDAERTLAAAGIEMPASMRKVLQAPLADAPLTRDKLARSQPMQTERTKREMSRIPQYRIAVIATIVVIAGLLVTAHRIIEASPD